MTALEIRELIDAIKTRPPSDRYQRFALNESHLAYLEARLAEEMGE